MGDVQLHASAPAAGYNLPCYPDHYIQDPALNAIFTDTVQEAPLDTVSHILRNIVEYVNAYPRGATEPSPPDTYSSNVMLITRLCRSDDEFREHLLEQNMLVWICRALAVMTSPRTPVPPADLVYVRRAQSLLLVPRAHLHLPPAPRHQGGAPRSGAPAPSFTVRRPSDQSCRLLLTADGILEMLAGYGEKKPVLARRAMNEIIRGRLDVREELPLDHTLHPSLPDGLVKQRDKAWEAWGKMKNAIIGDRDILEKCMNPKVCSGDSSFEMTADLPFICSAAQSRAKRNCGNARDAWSW